MNLKQVRIVLEPVLKSQRLFGRDLHRVANVVISLTAALERLSDQLSNSLADQADLAIRLDALEGKVDELEREEFLETSPALDAPAEPSDAERCLRDLIAILDRDGGQRQVGEPLLASFERAKGVAFEWRDNVEHNTDPWSVPQAQGEQQ